MINTRGEDMLEITLCKDRKRGTCAAFTRICKTAEAGCGGQILVTPEQFSHDAERLLCARGGDGISRYAEVLSFSRLASRVFSIEGGSRGRDRRLRTTSYDGNCRRAGALAAEGVCKCGDEAGISAAPD